MHTRRPLIIVLLVFIALLLPLPASAWNGAGHRLSALIAWQQLDESTRQQVSRLLAHHPDHERWTARSKSMPPELAAFVEASTWPDDIKGDKRFYDADSDVVTKLLPGFPDMARHRHWHYIDRPLGNPPKLHHTKGELDRRLDVLITTVGDDRLSDQQRAYALPWLIHLVADAHQPLHTVSRYDATGRADEGGNLLTVKTPFHPRLSSMNLHTYWDDLPGPPWLRGKRLEKNAARLIEDYPPPAQGDVRLWRDESHRLLAEAYPTSNGSLLPIISEDFRQRSRDIAECRIVEAGYRLGSLLDDIFTLRVSRETP